MAKEASSLKKAYCPHHKTENELDRIFFVNPDAEVCYCPICMYELKPKEAIENYLYFISSKINKAERLLYRETRFYEAYCAFGRIIEIDPDSYRARFGRILSLVYMSKLRKTHFGDAALLLEGETEEYFSKIKDQSSYFKFLNRINAALDEYNNRLYKKITIKDRFYNGDFVELYFERINEIIQLKNLVVGGLQRCAGKMEEERVYKFLTQVETSVSNLNQQLKDTVATTDGTRYRVEKVVADKHIYIAQLDEKLAPQTHHRKYKLNEADKKGKLLKDKIYPDNSHLTLLTNIALPLLIIFGMIASFAIAFSFITKEDTVKMVSYIIAGSAAFLAIVTLVFFIAWKHQLSHRHHLID